jgi:hypothetical protein
MTQTNGTNGTSHVPQLKNPSLRIDNKGYM